MLRNPYVDLLRGVSVLAVLIGHSLRFGGYWSEYFPQWARTHFIEGAYHGVTVFFVISGYLITQKFLNAGPILQVDMRSFYAQRIARILPPLMALTLGTFLFAVIALNSPWSIANLARGLLQFVQLNFAGMAAFVPHTNSALDPLWSLAVEEVFYILVPIVCVMLVTKRNLFAALLTFAVTGLVARYLEGNLYSFTGTFDQLAIGGLAAIIAPKMVGVLRPTSIATMLGRASMATLILLWFFAPIMYPPSQTVIALVAATYLVASAHRPTSVRTAGTTWMAPVQVFGFLSYEAYLCHMPIMHAMSSTMLAWRIPFSIWNFAPFALQLGVILFVSWAFERSFSRPMNALVRRRILLSRAPQMPPPLEAPTETAATSYAVGQVTSGSGGYGAVTPVPGSSAVV